MSKKDRKREQRETAAAAQQPHPDHTSGNSPAQPLSPPDLNAPAGLDPQVQASPDFSRRYFFIFWCVIVLASATAWLLAIAMPNVSESIIERWMMAALAAALAVFLFFYR